MSTVSARKGVKFVTSFGLVIISGNVHFRRPLSLYGRDAHRIVTYTVECWACWNGCPASPTSKHKFFPTYSPRNS
eukprot:172303-Chlamydomonas_euryale.AAC.1